MKWFKYLASLPLLLVAGMAYGTTTVYLRASSPAAVQITSATFATPVVLTTMLPHNLTAGDTIVVAGVCTNGGVSTSNGIRKVKAVLSTGTFSITDLSGVDIVGNGPFCTGVGPNSGGLAGGMYEGKLSTFTLPSGPFGWFDGNTGSSTRKLALGTNNGLVSLKVLSNVATANTSYLHNISTGDLISVWGSSNTALNTNNTGATGTPYTITSVTPTTFTFTTSGVSDGTYSNFFNACGPSASPNNLIGGTQDCLRISQLEYNGNLIYDGMKSKVAQYRLDDLVNYKAVSDGGLNSFSALNGSAFDVYGLAAINLLVDQHNQHWLDVILYWLNNSEKMSGVNFTGNTQDALANNDMNDFASYAMYGYGWLYPIGSPYQPSADRQTDRDKIYNDIDDTSQTVCTIKDNDAADITGNHQVIVSSGIAQGSTGTSITLSALDTAATGFYINNVVQEKATNQYRRVTAYNATSKVAVLDSAWNILPAGTTYFMFGSISIDTQVGFATATITGYNTHFLTQASTGDAITGFNGWYSLPLAGQSFIQSITSDTSMKVLNMTNPQTTSTPSRMWYFPKWKTGDCGIVWLQKYWTGAIGIQPVVYTPAGAVGGTTTAGLISPGGNNGETYVAGHTIMDLAIAPDDVRAVRDLAILQTYGFDWELAHYMNYSTGWIHSGVAYTTARVFIDGNAYTRALSMVPGFPDMELTGPWMEKQSLYKMYDTYPDIRQNIAWGARWASQNENDTGAPGIYNQALHTSGYVVDPTFSFDPKSTNAKYFRNWLETVNPIFSYWGLQGINEAWVGEALMVNDPRIQSVDYKAQPHQYMFQTNDSARCATLTGWPCPSDDIGEAVVSRKGAWDDQTGTHVMYGTRSFFGDHDTPDAGRINIYKVGELLNSDYDPTGDSNAGTGTDMSVTGFSPRFGNVFSMNLGVFTGGYGPAPIKRWASVNHGTWDSAYGDQGSSYTYVCSELKGAYTNTINHALRCIAHLKKPGTEEVILQEDDIDVASAPTQIEIHEHYPQNGISPLNPGAPQTAYPQGNTICPGAGGCANLNANRQMLELEDGGQDAGEQKRNYGLITKIFSPVGSTITLRDDVASHIVSFSTYTKTITTSIVAITTGLPTIIQTAVPNGLVVGEAIIISGVAGGGACDGLNTSQNVLSTTTATIYTVQVVTTGGSCSGGTSTNLTAAGGTMFHSPAHGFVTLNTVNVSGATGDWAVFNGNNQFVSAPNPDYFSIFFTPDTSAFTGNFDGVISTFYPGGLGNTHRISICGGVACGTTVNTFESLEAFKVASSTTDTNFTATGINPDANWTGVQTLDKVALFARGGVTHSSVTIFTTNFSSPTAQYLIGGLTPGVYNVTVAGTPPAGSPFTVNANDNSLYFESSSGTVSISGTPVLVLSPSTLNYTCTVGGGNPASQNVSISATGVTLDNWSATKGQTWLSLSPTTGSAPGSTAASVDCSGLTAGSYSDTISVASTTSGITNSPQTVAVNLTVSPSGGGSSTKSFSGKFTLSGKATIR